MSEDSLAQLLACPVCLEDFTADGVRVPRIFPCSHTLCEACIKDLIQNAVLKCPECRDEYKADTKQPGLGFPQNKYLVAQIPPRKMETFKTCGSHGQKLVLFCLKETCRRDMCILCVNQHRGHDLVNIEQKEVEQWKMEQKKLLKEVQKTLDETNVRIKSLRRKRKYIAKRTRRYVEKWEDVQKDYDLDDEITRHVENKIKAAEKTKEAAHRKLEKEISISLDDREKLQRMTQDYCRNVWWRYREKQGSSERHH